MSGYWLSGGWEIDLDVFRPNDDFMKITPDGKVISLIQKNQDSLLSYSIAADSIHFPFMSLPLNTIKRYSNRLEIGKFYPVHYLKLESIFIDLDTSEIKNILISKNWKSNFEYLKFQEDSVVVWSQKQKNKEKLCWELKDFEGVKLLWRKGNFKSCESHNRYLEYIETLDENQLIVQRWEDGNFRRFSYTATDEEPPDYDFSEFNLCDPFFYKNIPYGRFGFEFAKYDGGLYSLKNMFDRDFVKVDFGKIDGIVRIGFVVNCMGDIGKFDILELDNDYEKIRLNENISTQLLKILKSTGKWEPGHGRNGNVDTHKFLSFKIKNGRIGEVFF